MLSFSTATYAAWLPPQPTPNQPQEVVVHIQQLLKPLNVLYFGCMNGPGHNLHDRSDAIRRYNSTPWGNSLDGALVPWGGTQGAAMVQKLDGWTGLGFCDCSVDTRPGSHSTFLVDADITPEMLLAEARKQWPTVFARYKFKITLPDHITTSP